MTAGQLLVYAFQETDEQTKRNTDKQTENIITKAPAFASERPFNDEIHVLLGLL